MGLRGTRCQVIIRGLMFCAAHPILRSDKMEMNEIGGACNGYGEGRGEYRVLVGKPGGKRRPGRPRRRWKDNIEIDLQEVGCSGMGCIELAQDRDRWRTLVNAAVSLRVP